MFLRRVYLYVCDVIRQICSCALQRPNQGALCFLCMLAFSSIPCYSTMKSSIVPQRTDGSWCQESCPNCLLLHFTQNWGSLGSLGSCSASSGLRSIKTGTAATEEIVESAVPGNSGLVLFCFLPSIGRVLAVSEDFPCRRGRVNALAVGLLDGNGFENFRYSKNRFFVFFSETKLIFRNFYRNRYLYPNPT